MYVINIADQGEESFDRFYVSLTQLWWSSRCINNSVCGESVIILGLADNGTQLKVVYFVWENELTW